MASGQRSPLREKAEWLLRFAGMSLVTPRDFRRLRLEAHRWLDPDGARPLELGELRDVQAHIQRGLKALHRKQPWEHRVQGRHVLLSGAKGLHGPLSRRFETQGPSDRYVINAMDVLTEVGDRLRTCKRPGCGRAFIAVKRQEHCIDCAKAVQKARVASWRKRLAGLADRVEVRRRNTRRGGCCSRRGTALLRRVVDDGVIPGERYPMTSLSDGLGPQKDPNSGRTR